MATEHLHPILWPQRRDRASSFMRLYIQHVIHIPYDMFRMRCCLWWLWWWLRSCVSALCACRMLRVSRVRCVRAWLAREWSTICCVCGLIAVRVARLDFRKEQRESGAASAAPASHDRDDGTSPAPSGGDFVWGMHVYGCVPFHLRP